MKISAKIESSKNHHSVFVDSNGMTKQLTVQPNPNGYGSSINGGEFLFLAIATCYCNDIYRESNKMNINISKIQVEACGEFSAEGQPGYNILYKTHIESDASEERLSALIEHTDSVAEIHNTLRKGVTVTLIKN